MKFFIQPSILSASQEKEKNPPTRGYASYRLWIAPSYWIQEEAKATTHAVPSLEPHYWSEEGVDRVVTGPWRGRRGAELSLYR